MASSSIPLPLAHRGACCTGYSDPTHINPCRTLPSNLALCVNPDFAYVRAKDPATGKVYVVAESRLASIPGAAPKAKKGGKGGDKRDAEPKGWQVGSRPIWPLAQTACNGTVSS